MDDKAQKLIFVGYEERTKGYQLLDRSNDKVHISRSVAFFEGDPHTGNKSEISCQDAEMNTDIESQAQQNDDHEPVEPVESAERRWSQRTNKGQAPKGL